MEAYPEYRQSGIKWVGKIPKHWEVCKLKLISRIENGATPSTNVPDFWNGHINWITPVDLSSSDGTYIDGSERKITKEGLDSCGASLVPSNSIILSTRAPIGHINITTQPTCTNQGCRSIILSKGNSLFYYYLLSSAKEELQSLGTGSTFKELSSDDLKNMAIPFPSIDEQHNIAHYLELHIQRIDDLIKKKQKLIELLKEQRAAIINQAVTKGLNPNVRMKDSGVEWLGEIPEHWKVRRLKHLARIKYGLGQPPQEMIGGLPLIRATNIERGGIIEKDMIFVDPEDVPYDREPILRTDDIIVVRSGAYTADSAIIPQEYDGAVSGYDMVVRVSKANPRFVSFAFLSSYIIRDQLYLKKLRAAQPHLNAEELGETIILLPSDSIEQSDIADYLGVQTDKIGQLIIGIKRQIELLQEYRTALISEAVTGKIDVREE